MCTTISTGYVISDHSSFLLRSSPPAQSTESSPAIVDDLITYQYHFGYTNQNGMPRAIYSKLEAQFNFKKH